MTPLDVTAPPVLVPFWTGGVLVVAAITVVAMIAAGGLLYEMGTSRGSRGNYRLGRADVLIIGVVAGIICMAGIAATSAIHRHARTVAVDDWAAADLKAGYPEITNVATPTRSGLIFLSSGQTSWAKCIGNAVDTQQWETNCDVAVIMNGTDPETYGVAYFDDHLHLKDADGSIRPRTIG